MDTLTLWEKFTLTGSIDDYLCYVKNGCGEGETQDADNDKRTGSVRTDG